MQNWDWNVYDRIVREKVEDLKSNMNTSYRKYLQDKAAYEAGLIELANWEKEGECIK